MMKIYKFLGFESFYTNKIIGWTESFKVVLIAASTRELNTRNAREEYLSSEQIEKMNRYHRENDRENYFIIHGLVNEIFSKVVGCEKREVIWNYTDKGKPYIKNRDNLKFNISHTKGCAVVVLSRKDVGTDIEYIDQSFGYKDILNYSFTKNEQAYVNNVKDFYKYWVVKESYLKYKGVGLLQDLNSTEISDKHESKIVIRDKKAKKTKVIEIKEIFADYIGAICF